MTDTANDTNRLLTSAQAAKMLSISERKLWEIANRGEIPHLRIGRSVRFSLDSLTQWITEQEKATCAKHRRGVR